MLRIYAARSRISQYFPDHQAVHRHMPPSRSPLLPCHTTVYPVNRPDLQILPCSSRRPGLAHFYLPQSLGPFSVPLYSMAGALQMPIMAPTRCCKGKKIWSPGTETSGTKERNLQRHLEGTTCAAVPTIRNEKKKTNLPRYVAMRKDKNDSSASESHLVDAQGKEVAPSMNTSNLTGKRSRPAFPILKFHFV